MTGERPAAEETDQPMHLHADANMRVDHGGLTREQLIRANALSCALSLNTRSLVGVEGIPELLAGAETIAAWITAGTVPAVTGES